MEHTERRAGSSLETVLDTLSDDNAGTLQDDMVRRSVALYKGEARHDMLATRTAE